MVRRKRFPTVRVRPVSPRRTLEPAKHLRHALHAVHQLEKLFEGREAKADRLAKILSTGKTGRGGPLVVTIGVTVNMEDLEDVSDEALGDLEADIHEIMENTMLNTVSQAKSLAPVKTGALRESISGQVDDSLLMITFTADTAYAIYQEDGTSHNPPSPYLREPAAEAEEDMNSQIDDAITNSLDQQVQGDGDTTNLELETEIEFVV